ncbi:MAG: FAD-dependent oxidoreductase [Muricomes sp.]
MVEKSIWSTTASARMRPSLQGDIHTDAVIIGAGMSGILTAHFLMQAGVQCIVLERDRIGSGQTKNTTAKITSQHNLIYDKLLQSVGMEKAQQYAKANQEAIERYRILIRKYKYDVDWQDCPSYLYTKEETKLLKREYEAARKLGIQAELTENVNLPFAVKQALKFEGQGQFHPLKFLYSLGENITIYEKTKVERVEKNVVKTDKGEVHAKYIIFACHYPFQNRPGYYFLRMHQERSYVLAVKENTLLNGMYYGIDKDGISLRQWGEHLLIGGGSHRTGEKPPGSPYDYLTRVADTYWPGSGETARWSAQDCMTLDGIPYIGPYSRSMPDWYVATGFQKWGMTSSMVSAMILSDMICDRKNEYMEVFSPRRFRVRTSVGPFLKEGGHAVSGLVKRMAGIPKEKLEDLRPGHGGIVEFKGSKYGVYKDESGRVYTVSVRCPHMGCQLKWNKEEKSWDCPCHGSRFDYKGRSLDEPAQEDISY